MDIVMIIEMLWRDSVREGTKLRDIVNVDLEERTVARGLH